MARRCPQRAPRYSPPRTHLTQTNKLGQEELAVKETVWTQRRVDDITQRGVVTGLPRTRPAQAKRAGCIHEHSHQLSLEMPLVHIGQHVLPETSTVTEVERAIDTLQQVKSRGLCGTETGKSKFGKSMGNCCRARERARDLSCLMLHAADTANPHLASYLDVGRFGFEPGCSFNLRLDSMGKLCQ